MLPELKSDNFTDLIIKHIEKEICGINSECYQSMYSVIHKNIKLMKFIDDTEIGGLKNNGENRSLIHRTPDHMALWVYSSNVHFNIYLIQSVFSQRHVLRKCKPRFPMEC